MVTNSFDNHKSFVSVYHVNSIDKYGVKRNLMLYSHITELVVD